MASTSAFPLDNGQQLSTESGAESGVQGAESGVQAAESGVHAEQGVQAAESGVQRAEQGVQAAESGQGAESGVQGARLDDQLCRIYLDEASSIDTRRIKSWTKMVDVILVYV